MFDAALLDRAAGILRGGGLVAFPTETVYGLGANALDADAVARIYDAKGRPRTSPLIVHVAGTEEARRLASSWPNAAESLAKRFWPGPLTLVVRKTAEVPPIVTAGLETVGLRVPRHPLALALLEKCRLPLAAPSANRFGQISPTCADHVRSGLGESVDMVLDGGPSEVGLESTVVSVAGTRPILLRPGMITKPEIEGVLGPLVGYDELDLRTGDDTASPGADPSPGLRSRHYSPRTPLILGFPPGSGRGGWLYHSTEAAAASQVRLPALPDAYARGLYGALHDLDGESLDWIAVEPPPLGPDWDAIRDRLRRAAARE